MHPALSSADIREMELFHEQLIWSDFGKVLSGEIPLADAISGRICAVCSRFGHPLAPEDVTETVQRYDAAYRENRRMIPGGRELLERLSEEVRIGIITNGFCDIQREKIAFLDIAPFIDPVVISEEAGFRKPDRRIFRAALERAGSGAADSVYVGDSWEIDILPASACGMKAVWLNRYRHACPDPAAAREITSYSGLDTRILLGGYGAETLAGKRAPE
jgi:putative hydrolase of the HAD superfamily